MSASYPIGSELPEDDPPPAAAAAPKKKKHKRQEEDDGKPHLVMEPKEPKAKKPKIKVKVEEGVAPEKPKRKPPSADALFARTLATFMASAERNFPEGCQGRPRDEDAESIVDDFNSSRRLLSVLTNGPMLDPARLIPLVTCSTKEAIQEANQENQRLLRAIQALVTTANISAMHINKRVPA